MSDIDIRIEGRAGRITLNRPAALNALTYDMALAIEAALEAWRDDARVQRIYGGTNEIMKELIARAL